MPENATRPQLARAIDAARAWADLSREQVGAAVGVSGETIGRWERGEWKRQPPRSALVGEVAYGARIESLSETSAVVVHGHRPNHVLHLILTLVTLGVWGLVWLCIAIFGGERRKLMKLQDDGRISVTTVKR